MKNKPIETNDAPIAVGHYSQSILTEGETLYISGQLPIDPLTNEMVNGSIKEQTQQILKNIEAILKAANKTVANVVKVTILLTDINNFKDVNEVYAQFFGDVKPARSAFQVVALPKKGEIEIELIAN